MEKKDTFFTNYFERKSLYTDLKDVAKKMFTTLRWYDDLKIQQIINNIWSSEISAKS